jgi:hypothetical protein
MRAVAKLHGAELTSAEMLGTLIAMWSGLPYLATEFLAEALERISTEHGDGSNSPARDAS